MAIRTSQRKIIPHPEQRLKYGEREIDLGIYGWELLINTPKGRIKQGLEYVRGAAIELFGAQEFETHVEGIAYDTNGKFFPNFAGIYIRGDSIEPKISRRVLLEAWDFMRKDEMKQLELLVRVYNEVVATGSGNYARRLQQQQEEIAAILNYFADKIRLDDPNKAMGLEFEILKRF